MVYVHFTCWELFFIYLKHLPAKLYFPTNTHLGRKYPFSLCWGKRTFYCEKHISDKTSITKDIRQSCIFLLFFLYVYYTCCHWHVYSLLFIFILLCNFYGHELVVLRQWGLRFHNIHLRAKRNLRIAIQTCSWAYGTFFCQHARDQCVILKRTHFAVPALNTVSEKNNFNFLLYNLPHD